MSQDYTSEAARAAGPDIDDTAHTGQALIDAVIALRKARAAFDMHGRTGHMGATRKGYRDREIAAERAVLAAAEAWWKDPQL